MNILEKIFETKRGEIAVQKSERSFTELEALADRYPIQPFREALATSTNPVSLIAEVKRASPSQGMIRAEFDPIAIASAYASAGADCLSVLTDEPYFKGSHEYLEQIKSEIRLPCLRKDFICDVYQVAQARAWGADAILLIVAALDKVQLDELRAASDHFRMDVLLEVHDQREAELAIEMGFDLVGINNRDLRTFETSIETTERLAPFIHAESPECLIVSESALETSADVKRIQKAGARSALVGTAFCKSPDIRTKVLEVMGW